ncbi:MAG: hypothetical protein VYE73_12175 [Acidobacteriota bacterium]|nr:hypothetical protein [Acidobacteriota bacterium]
MRTCGGWLALLVATLIPGVAAAETITPDDARIQYVGRVDDSSPQAPVFGWPGTGMAEAGTQATLRLEFRDQAQNLIEQSEVTHSVSSGWSTYELTSTPAPAATWQVRLVAVVDAKRTTILFDDLTLAPSTPAVCGDGTCDSNDDPCSCEADCGAPPATEQACADGEDEDCNGNGICDPREDCDVCPNECAGRSRGRPSDPYCCGNVPGEPAEDSGGICDGNV